MDRRNERLVEISRFQMLLSREFPAVISKMANDVTRWGKVTPSTTRLVCICPDAQTLDALQRRFTRRNERISEAEIVFHF